MDRALDTANDHMEIRCPRLGGPVSFHYCRTCNENELPCWKIADCWWESFDIVTYLKANIPEAALAEILNHRPKPKITSLIELIQKAKMPADTRGHENQ
jgi:hypothetical protein